MFHNSCRYIDEERKSARHRDGRKEKEKKEEEVVYGEGGEDERKLQCRCRIIMTGSIIDQLGRFFIAKP